MLQIGDCTTGGKRQVFPPVRVGAIETTSAVFSVWLADNEEVEWHWSDNVVVGYTIRKRSKPLKIWVSR